VHEQEEKAAANKVGGWLVTESKVANVLSIGQSPGKLSEADLVIITITASGCLRHDLFFSYWWPVLS
jgi:hypothetical protein